MQLDFAFWIMKKGFTLIEALVYIAVVSIVAAAVSALVLWTIRANNKARALRETTDNMRQALDVITREVRQARSVYAPTGSTDQVSLETTVLPAGEVISFVDLYRCGTRLCIKREGEAAEALTNDTVEVVDLRFRQIASSTPAVQVALTLRYKNPQNRIEFRALMSATTTAAVR